MKKFTQSEDGFMLTFALIILPVFIGFALLIIDAGRGNNAHADLAAAADSVALAGARELDGGVDSITRAKAAMANLTNTVSMLAKYGTDVEIELVYEDTGGNEFQVAFLDDIPTNDTTPITSAWLAAHTTTDGTEAQYVYVRAQSQDLETVFLNPINLLPSTVPVVASAVAKTTSAACEIPPIYICNPFEYNGNVYDPDYLQDQFNAGNLHGRMIRLHPGGSGTHTPGNFGFLRMPDDSGFNNGAAAINDFFAGVTNPSCYGTGTVDTKPGASNAIAQGINTRFDIYLGQYSGGGGPNSFKPFPAANVRKGSLPKINSGNGNIQDECVGNGGGAATMGDDHIWDIATGVFNENGTTAADPDAGVYGFPDNNTMVPMNQGAAGAVIGSTSAWNIDTYFQRNYGVSSSDPLPGNPDAVHPGNVTSSFAGFPPSRYDVYLAEMAKGWTTIRAGGDPATGALDGEVGAPNCGAGMNPARVPDPLAKDRRIIVGAVIDCKSQAAQGGGSNTYVVNSYASMFMTRPMYSYNPSSDMTIDVEIVDISGYGGNGTLETYIRDEAILVR